MPAALPSPITYLAYASRPAPLMLMLFFFFFSLDPSLVARTHQTG